MMWDVYGLAVFFLLCWIAVLRLAAPGKIKVTGSVSQYKGKTGRNACSQIPPDFMKAAGAGRDATQFLWEEDQEVQAIRLSLKTTKSPFEQYLAGIEKDITIGRGKYGVEIRITHDNTVSERHCRLINDKGKLILRDLDSLNGTFLNGRRVLNEREVSQGDLIKIGGVELEVDDI